MAPASRSPASQAQRQDLARLLSVESDIEAVAQKLQDMKVARTQSKMTALEAIVDVVDVTKAKVVSLDDASPAEQQEEEDEEKTSEMPAPAKEVEVDVQAKADQTLVQ